MGVEDEEREGIMLQAQKCFQNSEKCLNFSLRGINFKMLQRIIYNKHSIVQGTNIIAQVHGNFFKWTQCSKAKFNPTCSQIIN